MKFKPVTPLLRPPLIGLYSILISVILHFKFPIIQLFPFPINLLGISGIIIGFFVSFSGGSAFQKKKTPIIPGTKPKVIVKEGFLKVSRNPMYLGLLIILLGISLLFGSLIAFISPLIFFLIINFIFIPFEEKLMYSVFGKKYLDYKKVVRRWI